MISHVDDELVCSRDLGNCHSFTLATRFGQMLSEAEDLYGPRDQSWTFVGVEFVEGPPRVWFPFYAPGKTQHIAIRLSPFTLTQPTLAYWELAHEVVHVITPEVGAKATYLEEGMATHFQTCFCEKHFSFQKSFTDPVYRKAYDLFSPIIQQYPSFIKELRSATGKAVSRITSAEIRRGFP